MKHDLMGGELKEGQFSMGSIETLKEDMKEAEAKENLLNLDNEELKEKIDRPEDVYKELFEEK